MHVRDRHSRLVCKTAESCRGVNSEEGRLANSPARIDAHAMLGPHARLRARVCGIPRDPPFTILTAFVYMAAVHGSFSSFENYKTWVQNV